MHKAESSIGTELCLNVCIPERETQEFGGRSHAGHGVVLQKGLSTPGPRVLCVMNLHATGREKELLSSLRSIQKFGSL
jgi:hypothetical protein